LVVAKVRARGVPPGAVVMLYLEDLTNPESLRPLAPGEHRGRGEGAGVVWAQSSSDGNLKVVIETKDLGHGGEWGFAYCDAPLTPAPFDGEGHWLMLDVPGGLSLTQAGMKIDDHWWKVLYNLD
jgi:hypothetical protein